MTVRQIAILEALSFPRSLSTLYKLFPHISQSSMRRTLYEFRNRGVVVQDLNKKWVCAVRV
jgi:hypothetical protein